VGDSDLGDSEVGDREVGDREGDREVGDREVGDREVGDSEVGDSEVGVWEGEQAKGLIVIGEFVNETSYTKNACRLPLEAQIPGRREFPLGWGGAPSSWIVELHGAVRLIPDCDIAPKSNAQPVAKGLKDEMAMLSAP